MLDNCFRFAPRDSIPGLIAKICKYLKDHPGWSDVELEEQIRKFISPTCVESFNGRTGIVTLDKNDVNNLKIASAYFAEGNESIDSIDLVSLYNQGVRFVFTDFNSVTSGYNLSFVLDYLSASGEVVYYPMSTGSSGGGNIVSVNGKTGVVKLNLADIIGTSGVQVKICTETEFTATNITTWNSYYNEGYRIVCVVNSSVTSIDNIYILKQDENNHIPIGLSTGSFDAYTPTNPPPYPVSSVNGKTGSVGLKVVDVSNGDSTDENAYIFIDENEEYPEVIATDSAKFGGQLPEHYATAQSVNQLKSDKLDKTATAADSAKLGGKGPEYYASETSKVNQAGWTPNKYLGTNASGEVVEKNTPDSPTHKSFRISDLSTLTVEGAVRRAEQEMDFTKPYLSYSGIVRASDYSAIYSVMFVVTNNNSNAYIMGIVTYNTNLYTFNKWYGSDNSVNITTIK